MTSPYKGTATTATGVDILNTLAKRLQTQGFTLSDAQLTTLMVDVMNTINTDSANVVSHAATEIAQNKPRPFATGV